MVPSQIQDKFQAPQDELEGLPCYEPAYPPTSSSATLLSPHWDPCLIPCCKIELPQHTLVSYLHALSMLSSLPEHSSILPSSHFIHSALPVLWRHHLSDPPKAGSHSFHATLGLPVQSFCMAFIIAIIRVLSFYLSRQRDLQSHKIGFIHLFLPKFQLILTGVRMRHPKL